MGECGRIVEVARGNERIARSRDCEDLLVWSSATVVDLMKCPAE